MKRIAFAILALLMLAGAAFAIEPTDTLINQGQDASYLAVYKFTFDVELVK